MGTMHSPSSQGGRRRARGVTADKHCAQQASLYHLSFQHCHELRVRPIGHEPPQEEWGRLRQDKERDSTRAAVPRKRQRGREEGC
jgi:hypothetical protein